MTRLMLTHPGHIGWHRHCLYMPGHHRHNHDGERDQHMQEPLNHGRELLRRGPDFKMAGVFAENETRRRPESALLNTMIDIICHGMTPQMICTICDHTIVASWRRALA